MLFVILSVGVKSIVLHCAISCYGMLSIVSYRAATWCSEVLWGAIWPFAGAMWCYTARAGSIMCYRKGGFPMVLFVL